MKIIKRLLIILGSTVLLLALVGLLLGFIYQDRVFEKIKGIVSERIEGDFDASGAKLTLFKSFPDATLVVEHPVWTQPDTVFAAQEALITMGLQALWKKDEPIHLKQLVLTRPDLRVLVDSAGVMNARMAHTNKTNDKTPREQALAIELKDIQLLDGKLSYLDTENNTSVQIRRFNHRGEGNFAQNIFDYDSDTNIESITVSADGVSYLNEVEGHLDLILQINQDSGLYRLAHNELQLNAFKLTADGYAQSLTDGLQLAINFESPTNEIIQIISLLPGIYAPALDEMETSGLLTFKGSVNGLYKNDDWPEIQVDCKVNNGFVNHKDLPEPVRDIEAQVFVSKPQGSLDLLQIKIDPLALTLASNPISGSLELRQLLSDPNIRGALVGKLDMQSFRDLLASYDLPITSGLAAVDLKMNTRMSDIEGERYDRMELTGSAVLSDFVYQDASGPIEIPNASTVLTPQKLRVNDLSVRQNDMTAQGNFSLDNPLSLLSNSAPIRMKGDVQVNTIDLDQYMDSDEATEEQVVSGQNQTSASYAYLARMDVDLGVVLSQATYSNYNFTAMEGRLRYRDNDLVVDDCNGRLNGEKVFVEGQLNDLDQYLAGNSKLTGAFNVRAAKLNANAILSDEPGTEPTSDGVVIASSEPATIPSDMDLDINAEIGQLTYQHYELQQVKGRVDLVDGTAAFHNVQARGMGGNISLDGMYTVVDNTPQINIRTTMKDIGIQQAYQQSGMLKALAPIASRIEGLLNSEIAFSSELDGAYFPKLRTLSLDGYLETVNGVINRSKIMEKLSGFLKNDKLKAIPIENTRNWVSIESGKITVQPFDLVVDDITLHLSGFHSLDNQMDYDIKIEAPRAYLDKIDATKYLNQNVQSLEQQIAKSGLQMDLIKSLQFDVRMSGQMNDPNMQVKFSGTQQKELGKAVKDEIAARKDKAIDTLKTTVKDAGNSLIDTLKTDARQVVGSTIKDILKSKSDTTQKESTDPKEAAKKEVDKIKDKLKDYNPFKKKGDEKKEKKKKDGS